MTTARAYFDESRSQPSGYFAVAGFVGSEAQWREFEQLWSAALKSAGAPYLHVREFAHSVDTFVGWNGDPRRERLMADVVHAIMQTALIPVGSPLRLADYEALSAPQRTRLHGPYYCCLQDVLYGFALMAEEDVLPSGLHVTGDRNDELAEDARKMYRALRATGGFFTLLSETLEFADMRVTVGLQAADLLAYEMTKELSNQGKRPEDRMRWPLDQIISEDYLPVGKALKYNTAEMLRAQADGTWIPRRKDILAGTPDESLRLLRDKGGFLKRLLKKHPAGRD